MQLLAIGINHHTAPLALRERVAFPLDRIKPALQMLRTAWHPGSSPAGLLRANVPAELPPLDGVAGEARDPLDLQPHRTLLRNG